jgi:hypothetical protein
MGFLMWKLNGIIMSCPESWFTPSTKNVDITNKRWWYGQGTCGETSWKLAWNFKRSHPVYIYKLYHSFWGSGGSLSKKRWGMGEAANWTIDFTKTEIFNNLVWLVYWVIDNQIFNNWTQRNSDIRTKILLYQLWLDTRFPLSSGGELYPSG